MLAEPLLRPVPRAVTRAVLDGELQFLSTEEQRSKTPEKCPLLRTCHRVLQKWIHTGRWMRRGCFRNEQMQPEKPCVDANLMIASGDSGSDGCEDGSVAGEWPATHPNVVAVGGTTLTINDDGSGSEQAWSGSGGGVSAFYKLPHWQKNFQSPFIKRSFPDIAFNADPASGEAVWARSDSTGSPSWQVIGGTSMAAPQWTGFLTLVNEARASEGRRALGFLNPILYPVKNKAKMLSDITSGSNGAYKATRGWNAVTGWGSMKGADLLEYLLSH